MGRTLCSLLLLLCAGRAAALPQISTFDLGGRCIGLEGAALTALLGAARVSNPQQSPVPNVALAYANLQSSLEFYQQVFGLDLGTLYPELMLVTNFSDADTDCSVENAVFVDLLGMIAVQKGRPEDDLLVSADLDVLGHEITHGVVARSIGLSGDCALDGRDEAGALNESISDMMGIAIRAWVTAGRAFPSSVQARDFDVGANVGGLLAMRAIRSGADPADLGGTDFYSDWDQPCDGPHQNSTVATLAFALLAAGGEHPAGKSDVSVRAIGLEKSARLVHYVLHHRLVSPTATVPDFASAMGLAAHKLHGAGSAEQRSVIDAFRAVGVEVSSSLPTVAVPQQPVGSTPLIGPLLLAALAMMMAIPFLLTLIVTRSARMPVAVGTSPAPSPRATQSPRPVAVQRRLNVVLPDGQRVSIPMGQVPVVIGREGAGLPSALRRALAEDSSVSRQHCQIWFDAERGLLYFRNLSANGTVVNGERLGEGEKGSIERISAFDMVLGRLRLWVELEATGRNG